MSPGQDRRAELAEVEQPFLTCADCVRLAEEAAEYFEAMRASAGEEPGTDI